MTYEVSKTSERSRVFGTYRFKVEIDKLWVAGFSEVEGLNAETEMFEYQEGGLNSFVHKFPTITKYEPIVLKRGISDAAYANILWDWYQDVTVGKVNKKNGAIIMNDQEGNKVCEWDFFGAYPISWSGPTLNAFSNEVAIESIKLVHEGFKVFYYKDRL